VPRYSWDEMISGLYRAVEDFQGWASRYSILRRSEVKKALMHGREAIVRSMPYNAKGKPGIGGRVAGNIEQVFLRDEPRLDRLASA